MTVERSRVTVDAPVDSGSPAADDRQSPRMEAVADGPSRADVRRAVAENDRRLGGPAETESHVTPEAGTPEYQGRMTELARDPAQGGRVTRKTPREAEVGLECERRGDLPGPIRRAELDQSRPDAVKDQGDFVDSGGRYWDVKGPAEFFPPYARRPGELMPDGQKGRYEPAAFELTIKDEIGDGKNVIVDTWLLTRESSDDLKARVAARREWDGKVVFYP
ncbi:hypothetical protein [Polymorphospora sp. NPDC050346]|uniref:hypothetical protein n=1 Tax=Polymorphospora sp. NPDC050346 TaxID=3155780 RepID=UPI0033F1884D